MNMKKSVVIISILLIISLLTAGCKVVPAHDEGRDKVDGSGVEATKPDTNVKDAQPGVTEAPKHAAGETAGQKSEALSEANKKFSWDIFKTLNEEDSEINIFISPHSISSMLTMALNGARGTTLEAIKKTLHYDVLSNDEINNGYAWYTDRISNIDDKVTVQISNSIWARDGFEIKQEFIETNQTYLSAEVQTLDFDNPGSADIMNNWISQKTNNLITEMITPPIPSDVIMYLINAIYFKGEWTSEFKPENTVEQDFYAIDGQTDKVMMMHRTGDIEYYKNEELKAVRLPYGDEKISMVLILPEGDINQWIRDMNPEKWNSIMEGFRSVPKLQLAIPKFKMEYGIKELNNALTHLGMGEAFTAKADFSGIANNICISKVMHKAIVDVNEEGTEAAAVTVGEMMVTAAMDPVTFIAERPFFFAIADNEEGDILFMGKKVYGDR